jgi:hypothetical protein
MEGDPNDTREVLVPRLRDIAQPPAALTVKAQRCGCGCARSRARPCQWLEVWLRQQRPRLSRSSSVAEPIDYMLRRWARVARFVEDGRICLTNNAAERALPGFALGRKSWLWPAPNAAPTARP